MIDSKYLRGIISLLAFPLMSTGLKAQERAVPLKNWATPLYWQPNQAERVAAAPQIVFSTHQVSTSALTFIAITPCRLADTRGSGGGFTGDTPFSGPSLTAGMTQTFPVQSAAETDSTAPAPCGTIPSIAQAYSLNVTVVPHGAGAVDYITIWPAGATKPVVSTLDDVQGLVVANAAIVPAGTPSGGVSVYNNGPATTDVIIDMNGFFAAPTDPSFNTAVGLNTLQDNTSGHNNTASGYDALQNNTTGNYNVANGDGAMQNNSSGSANTASGASALAANTTGGGNTANGFDALLINTTGSFNTASGDGALGSNSTGSSNTAVGTLTLQGNTTGSDTTATGYEALYSSTTGGNNTAFGYSALRASTTGSNNIALGYEAGLSAPVANSSSIYIGSQGSGSDGAGTIQIGTQGTQTGGTYIAGIYGTTITGGQEVVINSSGQLGSIVLVGSFRSKEHITDMGETSSNLLQLRPVNFFYKPQYDDGSHQLQYGLIAEEVAKVYPEMVTYGKDGQALTVKYQALAPMLLNELQKQDRRFQTQIAVQQEQNRKLEDRLAALEAQIAGQPSIGSALTSSR